MSSALPALRVLAADRRGNSLPVLVDTAEGRFVVKLRGAAHGTAALVAEVLVAELARVVELPIPQARLIRLTPETPVDDRDGELRDLLDRSAGVNLGFRFLAGSRPLHYGELHRIDPDFASRVVWLDWLVLNADRTRHNPNLLVQGRQFWLIDHGSALPFHHDWAAVSEDSPHRAPAPVPHLLESRATRLAEWDRVLSARVTRAALHAAAAVIPEEFLRPLLPPDAASDQLVRRRAAYAAFLWKRLAGPRHFLAGPGGLPGVARGA